MAKAIRALASAKLLIEAGDVDGACNRAYYAMFDAARAALIMSNAPAELSVAKTHSGLISGFSLHLVKTDQFPVELGKALNRAAEIRLVADYTGIAANKRDMPYQSLIKAWLTEDVKRNPL